MVSLGAAWGFPNYMKHIAAAKRRYGVGFAVLIYDMIPIENETLVEERHILQFRKWLHETISNVDIVLTISKHSQHSLLKYAAGAGWSLPRVEVVELGADLSRRPVVSSRRKPCFPQQYVLFVSTIEVRKNHR